MVPLQDIITIDGPAGAGKSTVSRTLARRLQCLYLDTGAMYRAVALAAKRNAIVLAEGRKLGEICQNMDLRFDTTEDPPRLFLGEEDISAAIRSPDMDMLSSKVSAAKEVRQAMTELQRKIAKGVKVVAEGRDMGTVVFPEARHKFFLTASLEVRALRRYRERLGRGEAVDRWEVEQGLKRRDRQDEGRSLAPLRAARDAKVIDSTHSTPEEVVDEILRHLGEATEGAA